MRKTVFAIAFATFLAPAAYAGDKHSGSHGSHSGMAEGVHTKGEVHAMKGDTVNLSHEPIPEIGWPAMTMDLPLLEGAQVGEVAPGDRVMIMLEKGPDGLYGIRALEPAE